MVSPTTKKLTYEEVDEWRTQIFEGRSLRIAVEDLKNWPLNHYLWAAVLQAKALHDDRDAQDQNWQTPAWDFGRFAKAHPQLFELDENTALRLVKKTIGSKFWETQLEMDAADAEMAFDSIWVQCRAVPGYDPVTVAVLDAKKKTTGTIDGPEGYKTFLEVARSLKRQLGEAPFMLPCHKLAPMLGCKPMTISRYRQKAIRDGYLKVTKEHTFRSAIKGEATEFTYLDGAVKQPLRA